ncbi:cytochrome P450 alkane hydroxylase protein [Rutstroemia sp. NJR-2017a BBW]|nr:cytochrome P450 alkane hydroxylase protein [Rutstroemia sp. NJR-2017a BBW]
MFNALSVVLIALAFCFYHRFHRYRVFQKVPISCQPPTLYLHKDPILGIDLFILIVKHRKIHQSTQVALQRHGKYGRTYQALSLGRTTIHTIHPENIKAVHGSNWKDWGVARLEAMEPFCGYGFLTVNGEEEWKRYRKMLAPFLAESNVLELASLETTLERSLRRLPETGETVDFSPILDELFLDTTLQWILGSNSELELDKESPSRQMNYHEFCTALCSCLPWMGARMAFGAVARSIPNKKWTADIQIVHDLVDCQIDIAMRKLSVESEEKPTTKQMNLVDILVNETNNRHEIRSQILQAILVTQDTTAILLSNAIFNLSRHPSIWESLREEVLALEQPLTSANLRKLTLLQNIFKETLRLQPPFANLARTAMTDTILPTGGGSDGSSPIYVFAGSTVTTSFYSLHRNPEVYGDNVEGFEPDRWNRIVPGRWDFMGFGGGPRGCAGQYKALIEASFVLAKLAQSRAD